MCPYCGQPLMVVQRKYPCSIVCYGHSRADANGEAWYPDKDCTNPDCICKGVIYSSAGGICYGICYLCLKAISLSERVGALEFEGERKLYHRECMEKL
jgi:hypothetical protein